MYSKLNVKDKILIDVGGNIADSALLYSTIYPKKIIICLEPDPEFVKFAKENIEINNKKHNYFNQCQNNQYRTRLRLY